MAAQAVLSPARRWFAVPYQKALANIVHEARELEHPEHGHMLAMPHTIETTRLVRNMGIRAPAPIMAHYDWAGDKPFRTQQLTAAMLTMNDRAFVLSEMGTGKTRATLHALNYLFDSRVRRALVVAPLSTLTMVWDREIFTYFPHLTTAVLHGTKEQRLKALAEDKRIYIINHDGLDVIDEELIARRDIDVVVVDEIAAFRNQRTRRWKTLAAVIDKRPYVWGLTGSPTPNEPCDAYGQCKLLVPARVPRYFRQFKQTTMRQISQFKWVPKPDANDTVFEAMQPAVRFTRDECVELPPVSYVARQVELSKDQEAVYKKLMTHLRASFQQGEVTAANEGVLFNKLLQISSGWVYTSKHDVVDLHPKPRLETLEQLLEEASSKVIVFVDFIHAAHQVYQHLLSHRYSAALVTGETSKSERDRIFGDFQHGSSPRVIVAHPRCMSHGLTLTAANTIIWYTPTTSLETFEQACARITRPGQTKKSLIVCLTGSRIEFKMYRRLQQKATTQGALLEMFEEEEA